MRMTVKKLIIKITIKNVIKHNANASGLVVTSLDISLASLAYNQTQPECQLPSCCLFG